MEQPSSMDLANELQSTRLNLFEIKKKDIAASEKLETIGHEIDKLLQERARITEERRKLKQDTLEPALSPYSKAWNRSFFQEIRTRLPRELRDMVYAHLWHDISMEHEAHMIVSVKRACTRKGGLSHTENGPECDCRAHLPHFVKPAFVGASIALEVVEAWYKMSQQSEYHPFVVTSVPNIERLVTVDTFAVGLNPADVLRKFGLHVNIEELVDLPGREPVTDLLKVRQGLALLSKIKNKNDFKLEITLGQRRIRLNLWPVVFDLIRPMVLEFEKNGAHVHIRWLYDGYTPCEVDRELNDLVKEAPAGWKKDVMAWFEENDDIHDRHRHYTDEDFSDYDPDDWSDSEASHDPDIEDWMDEEDEEMDGIHDLLFGGGCSCPGCSETYDDFTGNYSDEEDLY
ncbi:hypothetical protein CC86DRAFT_457065 [Ophiobolus disseminans]|uniref:Uncharacterized protein n=1 Tax=Ophiobolus disseminans TaxID=1469910 RepID=A0A6A6ZUG0_9PLEO|nr:hypothetical protein CC86DRAFT_457065 [Ophiobolus disseminans]